MNRAELGGRVLAAVSRSFYLSLRLLPRKIREPVGLTYLLARTSDTIADSARTPAPVRLELLDAFARMVAGESRAGQERLASEIEPGNEGERVLLTQTAACLEWLEALPAHDLGEVHAVMRKIIHGQKLDLERFAGEPGSPVRSLQTSADLEEYTYLVAGCVGEFWTRICAAHLPRYSELPLEKLAAAGIRFGQGLQLVNILRDLPADLRDGRCYLPAEELAKAGAAPGQLLREPDPAAPVFDRWLAQALEYLCEGARYIRAIRPARLRMACYLPWYLGTRTLALLQKNPPLTTRVRVKVPRRTVYGALLRAVAAAVWNWPVRLPAAPGCSR